MALVFQYGSNTDSNRLNSDCRLKGDAKFIKIAHTEDDFELDFTVWSIGNGCAAADIVPDSGRKIWGVLYEIPDYLIRQETANAQNRKSFDEIEGAKYERIPIILRNANGSRIEKKVETYVVRHREANLQTNFEYVSYILKGLRKHNIADEYIEYVRKRIIINNPALKGKIYACCAT